MIEGGRTRRREGTKSVNQGRISEILKERRHIGTRDVALGFPKAS
jgi:hypothetical protein